MRRQLFRLLLASTNGHVARPAHLPFCVYGQFVVPLQHTATFCCFRHEDHSYLLVIQFTTSSRILPNSTLRSPCFNPVVLLCDNAVSKTTQLPRCFVQAVADFPQLLCQGMGRAARIAFLLHESSSASCVGDGGNKSLAANGDGGSGSEGARPACSTAGGAVDAGAKSVSAADAYSEVCRRVADFASDNPAYPAYVDLLLSVVCRGEGDKDSDSLAGDKFILSADPAAEGAVMAAASLSGGAVASGAALAAVSKIDGVLVDNQRHRYQWREWQNARQRDGSATGSGGGPSGVIVSTMVPSVSTAESGTAGASVPGGGSGEREDDLQTPSPSLSEEGWRGRSWPTPSPVANELAVMRERALGAALTAVTKESGGKAAAAMLLSPPLRHEEDR